MTREEAIDILFGVIQANSEEENEALDMAIEALKAEPTDTDLISRQAAIDAIRASASKYTGFMEMEMYTDDDAVEAINGVPSAQPEWNNHTVACLLAEIFGDNCACNFNGIDEWLPEKCEVIDSCPNPVGVACWEQFLTHRAERRTG